MSEQFGRLLRQNFRCGRMPRSQRNEKDFPGRC